MKEKGAYKGKVVKLSRSKITRSTKRDKDGKVISTKASGGELIIDILWLDAPAAVAKGVIGENLVDGSRWLRKGLQDPERYAQDPEHTVSNNTVASVGPRRLIIVDVVMTP